ncbi:MAG: riboflavin biosynthesis protein RibF [Planctomycetota bacterium]
MSAKTAITIGNFDGVHRGHAALVRAARACVGATGRVVVVTFDPHPIAILRPDQAPLRLTTPDERERRLILAGADEVVPLRTTQELLQRSAEAFIVSMVEAFEPQFIVEGPDFHFGHRRAGSVDTLRELGTRYGFGVQVIDPVEASLQDQTIVNVSSSMVRWMLTHGRVADAARLLDAPFTHVGPVVQGDQRGRTIGFPTANIDTHGVMLPADGIYAGLAERPDGTRYIAAISVGTKPTFGAAPRTCEAYLVDYNGPVDDYGWVIRLEFHRWVRAQVKYDGVEPLMAQLHRDIDSCRTLMQQELQSTA